MAYANSVILHGGERYHLEPAVSDWYGARFTALGDSIVNSGAAMWDTVRDRLGFGSYRNQGVSGRPMADGSANGVGTVTTALGLAYSGDAMVYIASGTNDFKLNIPIGTIGSVKSTSHDRNTFFGAYRTTLDHILTSKPTVNLYLATPLQRDNAGYTIESTNTAGHMLRDYRQAVFDLGEMYSIPVIDMYSRSGLTDRTLSLYTTDGLHPNAAGYARMARVVVAQIRASA